MTTMQVSFPEPLKAFIDELVAEGTFKDSDRVSANPCQPRPSSPTAPHIEDLLGANSGPSTPMTPEGWDEIEREGQRLIAAGMSKGDR